MIPRPSFNPDQLALCYCADTASIDVQDRPSDAGMTSPEDSIRVMVLPNLIEVSASGVGDISGLKRHASTDVHEKSSFGGGRAE